MIVLTPFTYQQFGNTMPSPTQLFLLLSALVTFATADFLLSNTTVCMGAFPVSKCYNGVTVLSGTDYNASYTCPHLWNAENDAYITDGTAGPFGSMTLDSEDGICGSGKLHFVKDKESYFVEDKDGNHVGDCVRDASSKRQCSELFGARLFESMFRCTSSVCD